ASTRTHFDHRGALAVSGIDVDAARRDLLEGLCALAQGRPHPTLTTTATVGATGTVTGNGMGKTVFVFGGQGSQHPAMGLDLHQIIPTFRETLDEICGHLDPYLDRPLTTVMFATAGTVEADLLDHTVYTQPALFAFQTALSRVLRDWGITPDYLIGHS